MDDQKRVRLHLVPDSPAVTRAARGGALSRLVRAHPAISAAAVVVALGGVPSLTWELTPKGEAARVRTAPPDPRYASQSGSPQAGRLSHVRTRTDEEVDSAVETCSGMGLDHLAHRYGLPPDADRVARRFASSYERAFQAGIYRGCRDGLLRPGS